MSLLSNEPINMISDETYECPHCYCNILTSNQPTHDAICARRHAGGNQRSRPQMMRRENSSSGLPESVESTQPIRRPQIREDRNMANNKLITCPNCEKSIREQNLSNHMAHECESNDKIPCEFCDQAIPLSSYTQHVEDTHRREREEEQERHLQRQQQQQIYEQPRQPQQRSNERPVSPARIGMISRQNQNAQEISQPQSVPEQRDRSPGPNATQETSGGFMGFLKNLLTSATQNRSEPVERPQQERPREVERHMPSEQPQSGSRSLLSRLIGGPHEHEHDHEREERSRPTTMEDFFLRALQGRQAREREAENPFMSQPNRNRSTRTIRLGPHGTIVISSGRDAMNDEPEDVWQSVGVPQRRRQEEFGMGPQSMSEMGPMGLLLQMLAARGQGMPVAFNLSPEQMSEIEHKGLSKEDIESLSVVKYDSEKNKNLSEDMKSCPICLEEFSDGVNVKFLWCLHRFHEKCINQWLEKNTNCPICKKDFSEMNQGNFSE